MSETKNQLYYQIIQLKDRISNLEAEADGWRSQEASVCPEDFGFTESVVALQAQLRTAKNLLAVVHRDGGHYTDEHGIKKSVDDAVSLVYEDRTKVDELRAELQTAKDDSETLRNAIQLSSAKIERLKGELATSEWIKVEAEGLRDALNEIARNRDLPAFHGQTYEQQRESWKSAWNTVTLIAQQAINVNYEIRPLPAASEKPEAKPVPNNPVSGLKLKLYSVGGEASNDN